MNFCKSNDVSLVVVGPEDPLAAGIADHLIENGDYNNNLLFHD